MRKIIFLLFFLSALSYPKEHKNYVEKLQDYLIDLYEQCKELVLSVPEDRKVILQSILPAACLTSYEKKMPFFNKCLYRLGQCAIIWRFCEVIHLLQNQEEITDKLGMSLHDDLTHYEFCQITSVKQEGGSCGWFASLNAYAIEQLLNQDKTLNFSNMSSIVSRKWREIKECENEWLRACGCRSLYSGVTTDEHNKIIKKLGIKHIYHFYVSVGQIICEVNKSLPRSEGTYIEKIKTKSSSIIYVVDPLEISSFLEIIRNDTKKLIHLFISTPGKESGHVVLLTIYKQPGKKPLLIYLDSNNSSMQERASLDYKVPFFVDEFVRALDKQKITMM